MSIINLEDSTVDMLTKMSKGNPGAINSLVTLLKNNATIDPDSAMGEFGTILFLDTLEIYGSDIYILMNDKCNNDPRKMIMLLRAAQLGIISNNYIKELSFDQMRNINISDEKWKDIETNVLNQLPNFKRN